MNQPFPWSTILALQPRLAASGVVVLPFSGVEVEAGVTNVEDEARSRTQGWAAGAVNKPTSMTKGEVLEADEEGEGSAGRIMTSPNGIATPL